MCFWGGRAWEREAERGEKVKETGRRKAITHNRSDECALRVSHACNVGNQRGYEGRGRPWTAQQAGEQTTGRKTFSQVQSFQSKHAMHTTPSLARYGLIAGHETKRSRQSVRKREGRARRRERSTEKEAKREVRETTTAHRHSPVLHASPAYRQANNRCGE